MEGVRRGGSMGSLSLYQSLQESMSHSSFCHSHESLCGHGKEGTNVSIDRETNGAHGIIGLG